MKRIVLTSSFAAVFDRSRGSNEPYTYTSEDWNPCTYEEALSTSDLGTAYQASKKLAELEAWNWVRSVKRQREGGEDRFDYFPPTNHVWTMGPSCGQALIPQYFDSSPQGHGLWHHNHVPCGPSCVQLGKRSGPCPPSRRSGVYSP